MKTNNKPLFLADLLRHVAGQVMKKTKGCQLQLKIAEFILIVISIHTTMNYLPSTTREEINIADMILIVLTQGEVGLRLYNYGTRSVSW